MKSYNHWYCSKECLNKHRGNLQKVCLFCGTDFKGEKKRKYCSRECSNSARRGVSYSKSGWGNATQRRMSTLKNAFDFESCMVEGCHYSKTLDVHRLVGGKDGGEYVIGNMFAICPNHHAEEHRGICSLIKVNNKTLKAIYGKYR